MTQSRCSQCHHQPYSNGPIEGINRFIESLKRSCFGFKNQQNFFKKITA
ncbi:MAG: transposase [Lacticaseibacillus paracasei]|nr:transposase [Lacticaseibacillus paracasei]MCH4003001.1 transposase [Lacticaseibacillus paracasei]MCH4043237.1 transposase [Lacticaseibacillus paracasei]MCH4117067.1 transposase [Lacticaseibacillus paracasei]MDO5967796.1 transposase [Lacticaseibacillus paracasei]MDS0816837.1 transposase [Lacticaseibacillus paracasei]